MSPRSSLSLFGILVLLACVTGCNQPTDNQVSAPPAHAIPEQAANTGPASPSGPPPTGQAQSLPAIDLHIGHATLHTQIASTEKEREIGLMYVPRMPDNDGMIFLMPDISQATFWMKNTLIPLSVAFIDRNGVILDIHDMKALDESIVRSKNDQVAYALETNLHWFALNGIKPGDKIEPPPATLGKPQP